MSAPENTGPIRDELGRFPPGVSGNPAGRPLGARNRLSEMFFASLAEDYEEAGREAIRKWRQENPGEYAKMIASLQEKQTAVDKTTRVVESVGDGQVRMIAERVLARASGVRSN